MLSNRSTVPEIRFRDSSRTRWGVDVLSLSELRRRAPETLRAPQRLRFHLLLLVQGAESDHMVDFEHVRLQAGDVLWVRPGQVQQWRLDDRLKGTLLLIRPEAMAMVMARVARRHEPPRLDAWPTRFPVASPRLDQALRLLACVADALPRSGEGERGGDVLWHLLLALLLHLEHDAARSPVSGTRLDADRVHRLLRLLDASTGERLAVHEVCRRLQLTQSTLARACRSTQGLGIKEVIDRRVALEAKRLLVDTDDTVSRLAERLGFDEPTNFVKFFRRLEGDTPSAYRNRYRG